MRRLPGGRIALELKRGWADGTTHLLFARLELLEKLAARTPQSRINLILYHGVLAPHTKWRARIVPDPPAASADTAVTNPPLAPASGAGRT